MYEGKERKIKCGSHTEFLTMTSFTAEFTTARHTRNYTGDFT